jgi:organic hydroperoxide reductase OsmC/OhrA
MPTSPKPHEFTCRLSWTGAAASPTTNYKSYSRALTVEVPGRPPLAMSAAPAFLGDSSVHNPEDLLMAALSACHCLSYLALCAKYGIEVVAYTDEANGVMEWGDRTYRFTKAVLKPIVTVKKGADLQKARALHEDAHAACFIARSVNFPVTNEPVLIEAME